ncbi:MAG: HDOD domain-containing protein [Acidimicrobiales bacterium]
MLKLRRNSKKEPNPADELREVLGEAQVPTFPTPVIRSLEALRNPDSAAGDVAEALAMDPGLTVKLLRLVNSAGFSQARPVNSVDQAVAVAGFGAVESLVLSVGVNAVLPKTQVEGYDQANFWRAASRRATIARAFADELHPATSSLSFTAGLLQDMAIPLLAVARDDYAPLLVEWHNGGEDLHQLEVETFQWAHSDVAQWLCVEWDLPVALAEAIKGHHADDESAPPAVQLAAPFREEDRPDILDEVVTRANEEFGINSDRAVSMIEDAEAAAEDLSNLFV